MEEIYWLTRLDGINIFLNVMVMNLIQSNKVFKQK